ncbi:MAG TPA: prolyl oligopeptidase family serine peptidase [Bryobacteraceae bacterium]|nr:prolyl oligopeptidase family serine peptidase [Bryobacteraceae bacterium]
MTRRMFLGVTAAVSAMGQEILQRPPAKANARVPYGKDPSQFGDIWLPKEAGPHPTVLVIHGGFWRSAFNLDYTSHMCEALARAGAAAWNIEYRRIGDPGGGWMGTFDDMVHAAEYLPRLAQRYNLDLDRLVGAGHSAGGHLILWLAAQRVADLRGVAALAAISDLTRAFTLQLDGGVVARLLGGTPTQVPQRYAASSPMELLPISVPQRMLHGTADHVVPFEMSERFAKASSNAKLVPLEGAGHFDPVDPGSRVWPEVQKKILEWQF